MSEAYDRLIEGRIARLESDMAKHDERIKKVELWRNTVLSFLAGIIFAAGYFAKPTAEALKGLLPGLGG